MLVAAAPQIQRGDARKRYSSHLSLVAHSCDGLGNRSSEFIKTAGRKSSEVLSSRGFYCEDHLHHAHEGNVRFPMDGCPIPLFSADETDLSLRLK